MLFVCYFLRCFRNGYQNIILIVLNKYSTSFSRIDIDSLSFFKSCIHIVGVSKKITLLSQHTDYNYLITNRSVSKPSHFLSCFGKYICFII